MGLGIYYKGAQDLNARGKGKEDGLEVQICFV